MVFTGIVFLGIFLPILLILYYASNRRSTRNYILLVFSLLFYSWGEPTWVFVMILTAIVDFTNAKIIKIIDDLELTEIRKVPLIASIVINIGILVIFKYSGFISSQIAGLTGFTLPSWQKEMPIGISFYTFQSLSYIIDVYRGETKIQDNFLYYLMYVSLFPQLVAGPIVRYSDVENEINNRKESREKIHYGVVRFTTGLGKKVLLANNAGEIANALLNHGVRTSTYIPMGNAWLGILFFAFQIYFDFSGYSDMAIGLGKIFGFNYKENFNYPYESKSITDFWRRWHMSLGSFFRDYVYIPLGGNRKNQNLNIFIVWALTGLWHGASWNFILWGIYFGIILILEKKFLLKYLDRFRVINHIYAIILVLFGWVIFYSVDFNYLVSLAGSFLGLNSKFFELNLVGYTALLNNLMIFILFFIASTSFPAKIGKTIKSNVGEISEIFYVLCIFVLSVIVMIGQTYNPFLYFRF